METTFTQKDIYAQNSYTQSYYVRPSVPAKDTVSTWLSKISIVSGMLSAFFIMIIVYSMVRMFIIQKRDSDHCDEMIEKHIDDMAREAKNPRWELVENLLLSPADADWRVAIIEADVLLEDALISAGYTGDNIGDILTNAGDKSFATYNNAWNAHKVRNDIAHVGSSYKLAREDAVKTINMYRSVLEELEAI